MTPMRFFKNVKAVKQIIGDLKRKDCGKTTVLEVVAYSEHECIKGAKMAVECGCDILMGTMFFDSVNCYCKEHKLRYMPFVGKVTNRPSILEGAIDEMIAEANGYLEKGAYGIDLLGYRYVYDAEELIKKFVSQVNAPVCVAGSIDCYSKIDTVKETGAWAFTIGGAFFEKCFDGSFVEQINKVCEYIEK